jgi:hypothetical protein
MSWTEAMEKGYQETMEEYRTGIKRKDDNTPTERERKLGITEKDVAEAKRRGRERAMAMDPRDMPNRPQSSSPMKAFFGNVRQGYRKTVAFTQKYAPQAEQRFGRVAQTTTDAFRPVKMNVQPDFRIRKNKFVQLPLKKPIKRQRQHDFGKLSFDL